MTLIISKTMYNFFFYSLFLFLFLSSAHNEASCQKFGNISSTFNVLVIDTDDNLYTFGDNSGAGVGHVSDVFLPTLVQKDVASSGWADATSEYYMGLYLSKSGTLYFTGYDPLLTPPSLGKDHLYYPTPDVKPSGVNKFISVDCDATGFCIALTDSKWSYNWGQIYKYWTYTIKIPPYEAIEYPKGVTKWIKSAVGYKASFLLSNDSNLYAMGLGEYGQLGMGDTISRTGFTLVGNPESPKKWKAMATGYGFTVAIDNMGKLYRWGQFRFLDDGNKNDSSIRLNPEPVPNPDSVTWVDVKISPNSTVVGLTADGKIYTWGGILPYTLGIPGFYKIIFEPKLQPFPDGVTKWTQIAVNSLSGYAIDDKCNLYGWGQNQHNNLGVDRRDKQYFEEPTFIKQFCQTNAVNYHHYSDLQIPKNVVRTFPNPASLNTTIMFSTEKAGFATVGIYSLTGYEVQRVYAEVLDKGAHKLYIPLDKIPSGKYFVSVQSADGISSASLVVEK